MICTSLFREDVMGNYAKSLTTSGAVYLFMRRPGLLCLLVSLMCIFTVTRSNSATLTGTFSGVSTDFSTVPGLGFTGSFAIDPQNASGVNSTGPGYLNYAPLTNSVFLTFSSSLGTKSFSNKTSEAEILLGLSTTGDQSLILEIDDIASGFAATLNLGSQNKELFGLTAPYTGSSLMTGYAEYSGGTGSGAVDEGVNLTSLLIDGPLSTPSPPPPLSTVPLSPSLSMLLIGLAVLVAGGLVRRSRPQRALIGL